VEEVNFYERFPIWVAILSNLVGLSIYLIGAYVLAGFGPRMSGLYLLYCFGLESRLLKGHCVNCYYYGKLCGFGKGKLCSWLFKQGEPQKFAETEISWANLLPDFIVLLWPVLGGIILLVQNFSWLLIGILVLLVALSMSGNAIVRGSFACKYCRQKELGCPAARLFGLEE
jgi:hypothetical protein